jgi:hypothetical protein
MIIGPKLRISTVAECYFFIVLTAIYCDTGEETYHVWANNSILLGFLYTDVSQDSPVSTKLVTGWMAKKMEF